MSSFKYGVSLYSYTDDIGTVMELDEALEHVADTGATGIEILSESHVPDYPAPPAAWIDHWLGQTERLGLTATNMACWVDTNVTLTHDRTEEEAAEQLAQDLRLADLLGFQFIRPKFGVIDEDLTPHPVWRGAVERVLDLAERLAITIIPEIHSPTPIRHPVTEAYVDFIQKTGTKRFGLLIDTGIFQDRPLPYWPGETPEIRKAALSFLDGIRVPVEHLAEVIDYVPFIQAKFHHIDENLHDHHIPWETIVPMLKKLNYNGYLSSEYEGVRDPWVAIEQVRRQHCLIRKLEADHA